MTMLDTPAASLGADARAFVLLKSGRRLDLLDPDPQAWTDGDLAAGGASRWARPLSVAQHSLTVLAIREAEGPLTAREGLRELLRDAAEFMLGWDCIAPLKAQLGAPFRELRSAPPSRRRRALSAAVVDRRGLREAQAGRSSHRRSTSSAGAEPTWSRRSGIAIPPLLDDPLPPNRFARCEPWPPEAAQHLFMARFRELVHASRSNLSPSQTPGL